LIEEIYSELEEEVSIDKNKGVKGDKQEDGEKKRLNKDGLMKRTDSVIFKS